VNADEDSVRIAIDIIARRVVRQQVQPDVIGELWEDYPEIGANDWAAVVRQVDHLAERTDVQGEKYDAAYRFLAARADGAEA